ncbi:phage tail protein [Pseudomonas sp. B21-015]|uniref:phage tail protein n=1 Tax=Pseudomonas sp. B21-015 TaxID=2895473 RepID=UPI00215FA9F9|nr:phage tail protein [Pseudomonas sp. B21-015]UVM53295.1 phage tail protein [Pseudomonas sp. B21-015]
MDFPKSVPSVGLVDGKFVDEDPLGGTPGSLIPAVWGNSVTLEVLNVIEGAGLVPDEGDTTQLQQAISSIIGAAVPEATEVVAGKAPLASQQEAEGGADNAKIMTALRVRQAISKIALNNPVVVSTAVSKVLAANELGLVLVDSTAGATTITLPASNAALGIREVIIRRVDNGGNRLMVAAAGADKIKFHTHLSPTGYSFFVLMGAGDWWKLRSDAAGNWWPVARQDSTPMGRVVFETTTAFSPGGWVGHNGLIYNRADWPWAWDHAQQSGMLTTEAARVGMEGAWTSGDGALTFRVPEMRGEFVRSLDEGRSVDSGRAAGSWQTDLIRAHGHNIDSPSNPTAFGSGKIARGNRSDTSGLPGSELYGGAETRPRNIAYPSRLKLI